MALESVRIGCDGDKVIIDIKGRPALRIPWQHAEQVGYAISMKAQQAKEHANAELLIADQAVLLGHGIPLALANDPKILQEAHKKAVDLMRPGHLNHGPPAMGIPSPEHVGSPKIVLHPPRKEESNAG